MTDEIKIKIITALRHKYSEYNNLEDIGIEINRTSNKVHGDFYTNVAMKLAKILKKILLV
jgi:arginyl-tRNA synthetase